MPRLGGADNEPSPRGRRWCCLPAHPPQDDDKTLDRGTPSHWVLHPWAHPIQHDEERVVGGAQLWAVGLGHCLSLLQRRPLLRLRLWSRILLTPSWTASFQAPSQRVCHSNGGNHWGH